MRTWMCLICGWVYDEEAGLPDEGIAPGTRWEDVPPNWVCLAHAAVRCPSASFWSNDVCTT